MNKVFLKSLSFYLLCVGLYACASQSKKSYKAIPDFCEELGTIFYNDSPKGYAYEASYRMVSEDRGIYCLKLVDRADNSKSDTLEYIEFKKAGNRFPIDKDKFPKLKKGKLHSYYSFVADGDYRYANKYDDQSIKPNFLDIYIADMPQNYKNSLTFNSFKAGNGAIVELRDSYTSYYCIEKGTYQEGLRIGDISYNCFYGKPDKSDGHYLTLWEAYEEITAKINKKGLKEGQAIWKNYAREDCTKENLEFIYEIHAYFDDDQLKGGYIYLSPKGDTLAHNPRLIVPNY